MNLITVADNSPISPFAPFDQGVPGLGFGAAINNAGVASFPANLLDGRFGIDRTSVPEPSTVLLLSLGLTELVAVWWKKRQ